MHLPVFVTHCITRELYEADRDFKNHSLPLLSMKT